MANVAAGTVWNLPNFTGDLFSISRLDTQLVNMMGGLNGVVQTNNFQFPIEQNYEIGAASQPAITETDSLTAPTAISYVRSQITNVTQIFHEQVSVSYARMSNQGRLSGLNTAGSDNPIQDETNFQTTVALQKVARDLEYTALQGAYSLATTAGTTNKTRGINAAAGQTNAAAGAALDLALVNTLLKDLFDNGAVFGNAIIVVNSFNKQKISSIYGYAPMDRMIGGVNIKQIETDFGNIGIMLNSFQSASTLTAITDVNKLRIVTQPVPGKGNLFLEPLSKTGAGEELQLFGQLGIDHGPAANIGTITGLATS